GEAPVWGPDGQELFFKEGDTLMRVVVSTAVAFSAGSPERLFDHPILRIAPGPDCAIRCQPRRPETLDGGIRAHPCRPCGSIRSKLTFRVSPRRTQARGVG